MEPETRDRATPRGRMDDSGAVDVVAPSAGTNENGGAETVGALSELYLGNILYALELAALTLDGDGKPDHAAFYRGIARKLAEARRRAVDADA